MAADTEPEKEAGHLLPAICPECGASGHDHYREVVFTDAKAAVRALHKRGMRALRGSWWRPPNPDEADAVPYTNLTLPPNTNVVLNGGGVIYNKKKECGGLQCQFILIIWLTDCTYW